MYGTLASQIGYVSSVKASFASVLLVKGTTASARGLVCLTLLAPPRVVSTLVI